MPIKLWCSCAKLCAFAMFRLTFDIERLRWFMCTNVSFGYVHNGAISVEINFSAMQTAQIGNDVTVITVMMTNTFIILL